VTEPFEIVRSGYDAIGSRYRDASAPGVVRREWLRRLLGELSPRSFVVDLGCGSGEPATRILTAGGHRVLGIDASLAQLRLAQIAAPEALLVQGDITKLALRSASVDAVASFYAFGHIPSALHRAVFRSIATWLRPGGILLASAPVHRGDAVVPDWLGVPMFFGGIGENATRQALDDARLLLETFDTIQEDEGGGQLVEFSWIVARRPRPRP
jgi:SAM-dependent methyltransferase